MIIDTHQHFWKYNAQTHGWIDDKMKRIRKDFLPEDLEPLLKENGVEGCIAVQADQTETENDFLLQLSEENDFIKGIIGWVNFRANNIEDRLAYYAASQKIKGFRHVVQAEADPNFLLRKEFCNGIAKLEKYGFIYEILVFPHQLGAVLEFVRKFPNQKFVIDHIGKPYIEDGYIYGWMTMIKEIANFENVYCKLSGMITEADYVGWSYKQLEPYIEVILNVFGAKRLMFGSDWPVCLVAGEYLEIMNIAEKAVSRLGENEKAAFWGENAVKFYNL
ncbi:amidohydrolase family protein [Zunongwangia sp. HGR-M22]|uniref:amidohydrolase family protein n=1 Tax=Zunongwangia sp. HGR-M22 TaxID=3015168 RepID=UPI0022DDB156|nr:amidohydrolase family protein [Zunongwangia sp. HGR-M22]WBL24648.1 amidohydrolase family protein [Zunongwangia sp. HGR-M22]